MKILFIVESPAKAKIIAGYLKDVDKQNQYIVKASMGHVRDLKEGGISIEIDNDFRMLYDIMSNKTKLIKELQDTAKKVDMVYLAPDNDREGESIAWHLSQLLPCKHKRVLFNEITKSAIKDAIGNLCEINSSMVDAQQARRCIDRIVGFTISPVLWRVFGRKTLSAGRVQSGVMTILVDREKDITGFDKSLYWEVHGEFHTLSEAVLYGKDEKIVHFIEKNNVMQLLSNIGKRDQFATAVEIIDRKEYPGAPLITSSMQQEAYKTLGINSKTCMKLAQQLYENGMITYMRTDSFQISGQAHGMIKAFVLNKWGDSYYKHRSYQNRKVKGSQEAHEAIRPTDIKVTNEDVGRRLSAQHAKLYKLIYQRTVASQMADAVYTDQIVKIHVDDGMFFRSVNSQLKFPGFQAVYGKQADKNDRANINKSVILESAKGVNKCTYPPYRYNEGTLVKALEKAGIGRPSTYSSIIEKLLAKEYAKTESVDVSSMEGIEFILQNGKIAEKISSITIPAEKNRIKVTEGGMQVYEYLKRQFSLITDLKFTAEMEEQLDLVAHGEQTYHTTVKGFWSNVKPLIDFSAHPKNKERIKMIKDPKKVYARSIDTGETTVSIRTARYGPVIEMADKKFIDLKSFLRATGKEIDELTDADVIFLTKVPVQCSQIPHILMYARYGFYYVEEGRNISLQDRYVKSVYPNLDKLVDIDLDTLLANRNTPPKRKFKDKKNI